MTNGLIQAGIDVIAGVDLDSDAKETYEVNNAPAKFVNEDITQLDITYFEKEFHVKRNDDEMILSAVFHASFTVLFARQKKNPERRKTCSFILKNLLNTIDLDMFWWKMYRGL